MIIGGRFKLEKEIGRGGMGTVHRATDMQTGAKVAVKTPLPELTNTPDLTRFHREAEALRQLDHPNIVRVIDTIEVDDSYHIIMEYIDGGDLQPRIRAKDLSLNDCLEIGLDICDALTRTHRLGIVHRDLKPSNVLLTQGGQVKLTDFGIAHFNTSTATEKDEIVGTIAYMAPEVLHGYPVDARADIWSFGALFYEMLVGESPFHSENGAQVIKKILYDDVPDLEQLRPDLPVELIDLIYWMLAKDRDGRIQLIRRVGYEIESYLAQLALGRQAPSSAGSSPHGNAPHQTILVPIRTPPGQLPPQSTPLVGRTREVADIITMLSQAPIRMVTILAPGGMGKTRLAVEIGSRLLAEDRPEDTVYFDSVNYVSLGSVTSAVDLIREMASAVNYPFEADHKHQTGTLDVYLAELAAYLKPRRCLFILDRFEHLASEATVLTRLLHEVPGLQLLVTSRERLNVEGEESYTLGGVEIDGETADESPAVALFVQSAQRIRPSFTLEPKHIPDLQQLCRLLGGSPLAIVLAAAWVDMLSVDEIVSEMANGLDLLTTTRDYIPERQRSMSMVLASSWERLPERIQQVALRLVVMRGGFTREAAQKIAGANLLDLKGLVDRAFLKRDPVSGRFAMDGMIRQYLLHQQLDAAQHSEILQKHAQYYLEHLQWCGTGLLGNWQRKAILLIEADFENTQAAWLTAVEQQQVELLHLALDGLYWFAFYRGLLRTSRNLFVKAQEQASAMASSEAWRLLSAHLAIRFFDTAASDGSSLEASLSRVRAGGESTAAVSSLVAAGSMYKRLGYTAQAVATFDEVLSLPDAPEIRFHRAFSLGERAMCQLDTGLTTEGIANMTHSITLQKELGDEIGQANSQKRLGYLYWVLGDYHRAIDHLTDALGYQRRISSPQTVAMTLAGLSALSVLQADFEKAATLATEAIRLASDYNYDHAKGWALITQGHLAAVQEDNATAKALYADAKPLVSSTVDLIYDARWGLSVVLCGQGDYEQAQVENQINLHYAQRIKSAAYMALYLPVSAAIVLQRGQARYALEILACALEHKTAPSALLDQLPLVQATLAELKHRLGDDYDDAWAVGAGRAIDDVVDALVEPVQEA